MPAPLQSAVTAATASTGSQAATFTTANLSPKTKIIVGVSVSWFSGAGTITGVSDGTNSLTLVGRKTVASTVDVSLWAMDSTPDVGTKPTITATASGTGEISMLVQEVPGLAVGNTTALMIDGTLASNSGSGGSSTGSAPYSSAAAGEDLIGIYGDNGGPETWTVPAGLTADANSVNSSSKADIAIAYGSSTNGAESASWALTGATAAWATLLVAFKLAPVNGIIQAPRTTIPRPAPSRSRIITPQASGPSTWAAAGTASGTSSASGAFTPALLTGTAASVSAATGAVTMTGPVTWDAAGSAAGTSSASGGFTPALLTASAAGASSASGGFTQVIAAAAASTSTAAGFFSSALLPLAPVWPQVFSLPLDLSHSPAADPAGTPVPFPNGIVIWNSGGTAFRFVNTDGLPQVIAFMPVYPWASNGDPIVAAPYVIPALSTVWVGAHDVPHYGNRTWIIASSPAVLVTAFEP